MGGAPDRCRDHGSGVLRWGRVGLNSEYKTGKRGFIAAEQGGSRGWKITRREEQG